MDDPYFIEFLLYLHKAEIEGKSREVLIQKYKLNPKQIIEEYHLQGHIKVPSQ